MKKIKRMKTKIEFVLTKFQHKRQIVIGVLKLEITLDSHKSDHLPITNHHFLIAIGVKINDTTWNNNIQEEYRHF